MGYCGRCVCGTPERKHFRTILGSRKTLSFRWFERLSPAVRQLAHLLHRDFIFEVVRIEWIHSSLGRFRLRVHEINQRLFGGPRQQVQVACDHE